MGFNLTNERIQDTYPQLLQISGSTIVDGTGSVAPVLITSASYSEFAVTASYALNGGGTDIDTGSLVTTSSFNAYTSSNDSRVDSLTAATSSYLTSADISGKLDTSVFNTYTSSNDSKVDSLTSATSSYLTSADIAGKLDTTTFNSYTSSNDSKVDALIAATSSYLTEVPTEFTASSILFDGLFSDGTIKGGASPTIEGFSNVESTTITAGGGHTILGQYSTYGLVRADNTESPSGLVLASDSSLTGYIIVADDLITASKPLSVTGAVTASNALISGDLVVNGTASFGYLQSITGSAKIIGDAYIILNNDTPTQRYAGVVVQDSGSTNNTASFEFDGQTNDWFYEYTDDGGVTVDHGVTLFGPAYNTKGSHVYPTSNKLQKGTGGHHLADSSITDDGSTVSFSAELNVTGGVTSSAGFKGDLDGNASTATSATSASYALTASYLEGGIPSAGLIAGTGVDSIESSDITTVPADAQSDYSIAIGDGASVIEGPFGAAQSVAIGYQAEATRGEAVAIGPRASAGDISAVAIGRDTTASDNHGIAIGSGATNAGNATIVIGYAAQASSTADFAVRVGGFGGVANEGTSIGYGTTNIGTRGVAIGRNASATGGSSISIGYNSSVGGSNGISIGNGVTTTAADEINIGNVFTYNSASNSEISLKSNVETTGQIYSPTHAGTIASSTSSIDFDNGNFATLALTTPTFLANPSNLKSGTTYTLIIDSGSLITNHGSAWKFAGGTSPTYTDGTDILTCVSDGTNLYATALTDFQ